MKKIGTAVFGVRAPIIKPYDNLIEITCDSLLEAVKENNLILKDRDIVAVTEAIVAKAEGNFVTVDEIAQEVKEKFNSDTIGLIFPILSRNRFSLILKAISRVCKKLYIQLSYPEDEVGNPLISREALAEKNINYYSDAFLESDFRKLFPDLIHPFTGIDYLKYFHQTAECPVEIILANNPLEILKYTNNIINADIHSRKRTKNLLQSHKAKVFSLDEFMSQKREGGYNPHYGLLGSNVSKTEVLKLFPREPLHFVEGLQEALFQKTGIKLECLVYGDGAFKDPVGGIWELADPVVAAAYTKGLEGTPQEVKLKYIADNVESDGEITEQVRSLIKNKSSNQLDSDNALGTTPRRYVDLIGSLCDLVTGSGDKGTPIVLIQNYFTNYAMEE
ncbi:MAG: coenzyme F420-0:L-glutamate ligase [Erysipelotrichales bacterium]|nr:coenzyme F420-0:L-glutamate ligase [Erysipelotrichales bacterium]